MASKQRAVQVLLRKEYMDVKKNPRSEFFQVHDLVGSNLQSWEIYVVGPPETPYEGGVYKAILKFPDEYPMKPPTLQFLCQMLHPNIYKDGKVCISTLQSGPEGPDKLGHYWRPVLGIEQAILSVVSLLSDPNLDDPANTAAANLYRSHRNDFLQRCKALAKKSMALVPEDFEYPKVNHEKQDAKRDGLRPTLQIPETPVNEVVAVAKTNEGEDDDFKYDLEDIDSEDEEEDDNDDTEDVVKPLPKKDDDDNLDGSGTSNQGGSSGNDSARKADAGNRSSANKSDTDSEEASSNHQTSGQGTNQACRDLDADIALLDEFELEDITPIVKRKNQKRISMGLRKTLLSFVGAKTLTI